MTRIESPHFEKDYSMCVSTVDPLEVVRIRFVHDKMLHFISWPCVNDKIVDRNKEDKHIDPSVDNFCANTSIIMPRSSISAYIASQNFLLQNKPK